MERQENTSHDLQKHQPMCRGGDDRSQTRCIDSGNEAERAASPDLATRRVMPKIYKKRCSYLTFPSTAFILNPTYLMVFPAARCISS